ncbi:uncharacterized protein CXQ87_002467 [Candidozyma duobushaemuli]|uniref:Aminotransferase class I/classII large domain-containing protein n=1 Tax=Candidozyma duobushaemuli TaxID=1231522 RepID=A0A2V1A8Q4_9ASCO|nr:uncharacterized protein CXQ87_002467 [[Candida] duobushaemulonis]PVH14338.1 hypothetical protein CXQ87_002467 [[Candida] duobushaemulonis]
MDPYGSDSESVSEFERLESTLPQPLRRSASSLLEKLTNGSQTHLSNLHLDSPTPRVPHHQAPSNSLGHLLSKLSMSENGRESSPIPLPRPDFNEEIHKPAMNTKQSSTGVLWVTERANEYGFQGNGDDSWANLGQGAPEHGDTIPGSFKRPKSIEVPDVSREYAPTAGIKELRESVANLYNSLYREGKESKYTYKNVCIVPGGRAGLIHAFAFQELLPIPVPLDEVDNYEMHLAHIDLELKRGVSAFLTSNPETPPLKRLHKICRDKCLLIMDEFYSHYYYDDDCSGSSISSAQFVKDVNKDPVLILNGLTKAFRLPGWRICWILGPEEYINSLSSAGSYLDGGSNAPFQYAAIDFLKPLAVKAEMKALQLHFKMKRDYIIGRLSKMGFPFTQKNIPNSTFYLWLNLSHLPGKLSNCLGFFHECLHEKVIVVPGFFFLINPQNLSRLEDVIWYNYVRISYGPELPQLVKGMDGIERILRRFNALPADYKS